LKPGVVITADERRMENQNRQGLSHGFHHESDLPALHFSNSSPTVKVVKSKSFKTKGFIVRYSKLLMMRMVRVASVTGLRSEASSSCGDSWCCSVAMVVLLAVEMSTVGEAWAWTRKFKDVLLQLPSCVSCIQQVTCAGSRSSVSFSRSLGFRISSALSPRECRVV
jgi:hypothetical protein